MLAVSIFWHAANSRRSMLDSSFEFMGPFSYSVNAVVHLLKQLDRTVIASRLRVFSIRKETRDGWDVSDTVPILDRQGTFPAVLETPWSLVRLFCTRVSWSVLSLSSAAAGWRSKFSSSVFLVPFSKSLILLSGFFMNDALDDERRISAIESQFIAPPRRSLRRQGPL